MLAEADQEALFRAAADWLAEGPGHRVTGVRWVARTGPDGPPAQLRIRLAPGEQSAGEQSAEPAGSA